MLQTYIEQHKQRFVEELLELLRIPSVSADSNHKADVARAAQYIHDKLKQAGADKVEICPTEGHPIVFAEKIINPSLPTVLVYGHYDVQPPDPLNLWVSPAFEPVIKKQVNDQAVSVAQAVEQLQAGYKIFARGACDDKGQVYMHIKAFEAMVANNALPCNVKFMIEGEEEVGSDHLGTFIKDNKAKLKADVILVSDTAIIANDTPSIDVGLRGLSYLEVEVTGANRDLHSGTYGGAVANPINVLCQMIASLKDANHHITIPHFYDDVIELSQAERQ
ncbi:MAG TPA: peptidase dimerization domain protein, partial [Microscillaceae bacterium]|nr:peptidase dimerization domain protein [Microscillaceae bacterium]